MRLLQMVPETASAPLQKQTKRETAFDVSKGSNWEVADLRGNVRLGPETGHQEAWPRVYACGRALLFAEGFEALLRRLVFGIELQGASIVGLRSFSVSFGFVGSTAARVV